MFFSFFFFCFFFFYSRSRTNFLNSCDTDFFNTHEASQDPPKAHFLQGKHNKTKQQNHHHPEEISFKKESDPQEKDLEIDDGGKESYQLLRKFKISKKKARELSNFSVRDIELAVKEVKSMDDVKSFAGMLVSVLESGSYKQPEKQVEEEEPDYKRYITGEWADFIEY